jgi:hypothetical protein
MTSPRLTTTFNHEERFMSSKLIDPSHEVEHGMIMYKGLPAPIICGFLSREESRKHYAAGTASI